MRILILFVLLVPSKLAEAQSIKLFLDALVKMETSQVEKYLSDDAILQVESSFINGAQNVASKLTGFVSSNGIKGQKMIHEAVSKGKATYMGIGNLISDKTKYRIYVTFSQEGGKNLIHEIRIEKDAL